MNFFFNRQLFQYQNINNNRLSAVHATPMKDLTSTNDNTFSLDRHVAASTNNNIDPPFVPEKKWYGNSYNRMSSHIVNSRRVNAVGKGTMNPNGGEAGFTNNNDMNNISRSLVRVRRMGSAAPPKCNKKI